MGSSGAMVEYGLCLTYGKGTLKNEKAGIVQFKKAAAAGKASLYLHTTYIYIYIYIIFILYLLLVFFLLIFST